jgi:hypothetical protein
MFPLVCIDEFSLVKFGVDDTSVSAAARVTTGLITRVPRQSTKLATEMRTFLE